VGAMTRIEQHCECSRVRAHVRSSAPSESTRAAAATSAHLPAHRRPLQDLQRLILHGQLLLGLGGRVIALIRSGGGRCVGGRACGSAATLRATEWPCRRGARPRLGLVPAAERRRSWSSVVACRARRCVRSPGSRCCGLHRVMYVIELYNYIVVPATQLCPKRHARERAGGEPPRSWSLHLDSQQAGCVARLVGQERQGG
jgi:hypothetical protein